MISYGGLDLSIPDPATVALIEGSPLIANLMELQRPEWTGTADWRRPTFDPVRPVRLGSLVWPTRASRFAYGHYIVSDTMMQKLRRMAYTHDSRGQIALPLIISSDQNSSLDPDRTIRADMYFLPPRPLRQFVPVLGDTKVPPADNLNLLTLVDERFFWWRAPSVIAVGNGMAWSDLYDVVGAALGITIDADEVDEAYLSPSPHLASTNEYLPLILDAAAYSVGQRIVRGLDGVVHAQSYDTASDISNDLHLAYVGAAPGGSDRRNEGGLFRFYKPADNRQDLTSLVPASVSMRFPIEGGGHTTYLQTLIGLSLDEYQGVLAKDDTKIIHSSAKSTPDNEDDLAYLLKQWAADWYLWQLGDVSVVLSGIVPWDGDGLADVVEWHAYGTMSTVVSREPMNDLALKVWHSDSTGIGSGSGGEECVAPKIGGVEFADLPDYDPEGEDAYIPMQQGGCAVKIGVQQCPTSGSGS